MRLAAAALAVNLATAAAASDALRVSGAPESCIADIVGAVYDGPTDRYAHGVLGDAIEWESLFITLKKKDNCLDAAGHISVTLSDSRVFEDLAPRLADLDGDGIPEVVTVEASLQEGARLTIWGVRGNRFVRRATTPFIGRANRWLAPVGAADLDRDGVMEVAYVDRPHLAKTLRVWRFEADRLTEIASLGGVSNHRIGEDFISGGIRDCGDGPEVIVADAGWSRIVAVTFDGAGLTARVVAPFEDPASFAPILACEKR